MYTDGNINDTFKLDSQSRQLMANIPLDRENIASYMLTITATKSVFNEVSLILLERVIYFKYVLHV